MSVLPERPASTPLPAFGMVALVLGVIALLFVFLPVLGIPVGACGLFFGVVGVVLSCTTPTANLRWSLGGVLLTLVALLMNIAIASAPSVRLPTQHRPALWDPVPDRPFVPPPAKP